MIERIEWRLCVIINLRGIHLYWCISPVPFHAITIDLSTLPAISKVDIGVKYPLSCTAIMFKAVTAD